MEKSWEDKKTSFPVIAVRNLKGIGHFSSEIGPSTVFGVYKQIKKREQEGLERKKILDEIIEKFGDKNPNVNTLYKQQNKCCEKSDE